MSMFIEIEPPPPLPPRVESEIRLGGRWKKFGDVLNVCVSCADSTYAYAFCMT